MQLEIIIVSFNTSSLLKNCLQSLFKCLGDEKLNSSTNVTVIDNNSSDDSLTQVKKFFPQVKIIANKQNVGFAKANNQAISASKSDFILLLNSDTLVHKNAVSILLNYLKDNSKVSVVGPKLLNLDGSLQQSFGFSPTLGKVFFWLFFLDDIPLISQLIKPYHAQAKNWYQNITEVDWVSGAVLMFRTEIRKSVGLLDEKIFMYGEEVEWCYRIIKQGGKIVFTPHAQITHLGGGSQKIPGSNITREFESINYFYKKYYPQYLIFVRLLLKCGALLRLFLFGIIGNDSSKIALYAKAFKMA